ncbi:transposase [Streptomyces sp. NPDC001663]|uniref:transposase n=1 Tax=Streptomyces sp. NPDC001663 TaxID=3364597 RepID=UPI0036B903A9
MRAAPAVFGPVASDPTVSRLFGQLASGGKRVLAALRTARTEVREHVWRLAGDAAPDAGGQVIVDIDGVLVLAHSRSRTPRPGRRRSGTNPLMGFVDHSRGGSGEPVVGLLRPGNACSNTAADHIEATKLALAQLPKRLRRGRQTLIRTDSGGGTHEFVAWLARRGRWLSYSVGMTSTDAVHQAVLKVPTSAWTPAVEPDGDIRDDAWVAELAGDCLTGWPKGLRLIVRKERPHPGAQLRFTDADGMRLTCFATNTASEAIAALELRHRQRARAEDRIRAARTTGMRNLRPAPGPTEPQLTSTFRPCEQHQPTGAVEPWRTPDATAGHSTCPDSGIPHQHSPQRVRQQADGPSCKIEANVVRRRQRPLMIRLIPYGTSSATTNSGSRIP